MLSWINRNWKRIVWLGIFVIPIYGFGSYRDFFQTIRDLINLNFTLQAVSQFSIITASSVGLGILIWDTFIRKPSAKIDPRQSYRQLFNASINTQELARGQTLRFKVTFKGRVRNGFFFAHIIDPNRKEYSAWDPETLPQPTSECKGTLHGKKYEKDREFPFAISGSYPIGRSEVHVHIVDHYCLPLLVAIRTWRLRNLTPFHPKDRNLIAKPFRFSLGDQSFVFTVKDKL